MPITRRLDLVNLVRELAENRISAIEIVREALSNAKDHGAKRVWIRTTRDARNQVSILIIDDGEGMDEERLEAFWGVGASVKSTSAIGYKGHGTKLFFDCARLSVASRSRDSAWRLTQLDQPLRAAQESIEDLPLPAAHPLHDALASLDLLGGTGTAISIEALGSEDRAELLSRQRIESFCDWFSVIGDVRSGLFDSRKQFHDAIASNDPVLDYLRRHDSELVPIDVRLRINGEKGYRPLGQGPGAADKAFLSSWRDDLEAHADRPALLAFGHRFANFHESQHGASRVRDDMSALRLTDPTNWSTDDGLAVVARVEGHRRQRQTYLEASWQNHRGLYKFDDRFGLWLCRDFVPVAQRNDLLRRALDQALPARARFEIRSLRNWKVFVNDQGFRPTANRNDIANQAVQEDRIITTLVGFLRESLKQPAFTAWVGRLQAAARERARDREVAQIEDRRSDIRKWMSGTSKGDIELADVSNFARLDPEQSMRLRAPQSEQELFFIYALLSGRHEMPVSLMEYNASQGVDAIGLLNEKGLLDPPESLVRVELKLDIQASHPIHHFFDAIDLILCWKVGRLGKIWEETSATVGDLRRRTPSRTEPGLDTHEIAYEGEQGPRVIPILQLSELFRAEKPKARRSR